MVKTTKLKILLGASLVGLIGSRSLMTIPMEKVDIYLVLLVFFVSLLVAMFTSYNLVSRWMRDSDG